ncbi:uroporphyrinogen-III synthase [Paracoccus isoporae]|uniref:Uroporphyrinogen-III synthase n=1 Tax=Paracoccus isoporae TaxID=591205 RepID=A0A1G6TEB0_9RHOB|nr:uroporphyrinogen-III synthase [Paracoccus isoporae]SDD27369.1 uroporphyrinogen-III synthase [Paracoccus isoporae]
MTAPICLLTRPEAQSCAIAAKLDGMECLISPILRIAPLRVDAARIAAAPGLIFTSVNAVPFAGPPMGRHALCVGPQTADAARAAGFDVIEGPGDAEGLLAMLEGRRDWLHLHGLHRARALPVPSMAVYEQLAQPFSAGAMRLLNGPRPLILPVFSPRSASLLSPQVAGSSAPLTLVAISKSAEAAYTGPAARRIIAARPDRPSMIDAIRAAPSGGTMPPAVG